MDEAPKVPEEASAKPQAERIIPFRNFIPESDEEAYAPDRLRLSSDVLFPELVRWSADLAAFRNLQLMDESGFVNWARKRGVEVAGIVSETDVDLLWRRGWLRVDDVTSVSRSWNRRRHEESGVVNLEYPLGTKQPGLDRWRTYEYKVHPFRIYPILRLLRAMKWNLIHSNVLYGPGVMQHAKHYVAWFRKWSREPAFADQIRWWNGVADLAILLEPLYWPVVLSGVPGTTAAVQPGWEDRWQCYREGVLDLVRRIPKASIAKAHMELRLDAGQMDDNSELYLILRAMNWRKREQVNGHLGGSLWLRHMAEVLRHAYDELYDDRLVHEDEDFGVWYEGARKWVYGSEYPLDDIPDMVQRIVPRWGLTPNVRVRFYVEGDTEQGALEAPLQGTLGSGIEVINLRAHGWNTWLRDELENDKRAKRISLLMLDADEPNALRAVKSLARQGLIVGMVFLNDPDIEFGCFSGDQLCRAVCAYETILGLEDASALHIDLLAGVSSGADLSDVYAKTRRTRGLKGKAWGEALFQTAFADRKSTSDESNKLVYAVACAHRSVTVDYEAQRVRYRVNPETLASELTGDEVMPSRKLPKASDQDEN